MKRECSGEGGVEGEGLKEGYSEFGGEVGGGTCSESMDPQDLYS